MIQPPSRKAVELLKKYKVKQEEIFCPAHYQRCLQDNSKMCGSSGAQGGTREKGVPAFSCQEAEACSPSCHSQSGGAT